MRTEEQLREALDLIAARAPDADRVLARLTLPSTADPTPRLRKSKGTPLTTGLALVLTVVVVVAVVVIAQLVRRATPDPADRRSPGYFAMVSRLVPPSGWTVQSRQMSGASETTAISDATGKGVCSIEIGGRGAALQHPVPTDTEPVTVGGRAGRYQSRSDTQVGLYWQHSPGSWASITCGLSPSGLGSAHSAAEVRDLVVSLAQSVSFGEYPLRVPVRIARLPTGYHVGTVREPGEDLPTDWGITISPSRTTTNVTEINVQAALGDIDQPNTQVGDYPATFTTQPLRGTMTTPSRPEVSITSLCVQTAPIGVCVSVENTAADDPDSRYDVLHEVASQISYATSPTDTTTWFNAASALPS